MLKLYMEYFVLNKIYRFKDNPKTDYFRTQELNGKHMIIIDIRSDESIYFRVLENGKVDYHYPSALKENLEEGFNND